MPLDPQARRLLDQMIEEGMQPHHAGTVAEARAAILRRLELFPATPEPVFSIQEGTLPGPGGPLRFRAYRPSSGVPLPVLAYFHGGGWVTGNLDSHDHVCRALANQADCLVVSVDYRLAPEHKFPAPAEDAYAATTWLTHNAADLGGDPSRVAVGGDSAGANLATSACLMARDRGGPRVIFQALFYPVADFAFDTASYLENAEGLLLARADMMWFWGHYLRSTEDGLHPYASPLRAAELAGLPPALVITAEYDPLRDEGEAYAKRLRQAGVSVELTRYNGMIHGFVSRCNVLDRGAEALRQAAASLRYAYAARRH